MKPSNNAIELIKRFEGCRLEAYFCPAGVLTIGYGHTKSVKQGQCISQQEADELLRNEIEEFSEKLNKLIKTKVTQNQFDALISLAYNIGLGNLEKSTLLKLVNQGRFISAASEFEKWKFANGKILPGLIRRRKAEAELFMKE